jgi:hypothetical protein
VFYGDSHTGWGQERPPGHEYGSVPLVVPEAASAPPALAPPPLPNAQENPGRGAL